MAQSRVNKIASVFTRVNGLLKAEIIPWNDRPIWYDIYKQFPPDRDPVYRSIIGVPPEEQPRLPPKILYHEDKIRSMYHLNLRPMEPEVLNSNNRKQICEIFIEVYYELKAKGISKDNLITATCEEMKNRGLEVLPKDQYNAKSSNITEETTENESNPKEDQFKSMLTNLMEKFNKQAENTQESKSE